MLTIQGGTCVGCSDIYVITRDGTFRDDTDPHRSITVHNAAAAAQLFEMFPADQLSYAATHPLLGIGSNVVSVTNFTTTNQTVSTSIPIMGGVDWHVVKLSNWVYNALRVAQYETEGTRRNDIVNALNHRTLRYVRIDMLGCYGWCPIYSATFSSNGIAHLHVTTPGRCSKNATAAISLGRLIAPAGNLLANLRPYYPLRAQDTPEARITIATRTGTYTSFGPDETTWGADFAAVVARWDQLVRDSTWNPPTRVTDCTRAPRS